MKALDASSTAAEAIAGVSLAGRVAVVTGASSGLGSETSRALAAAGARVIMSARNREQLAAAIDAVRAAEPGAEVVAHQMDLADLDSVRRGAAELLEQYPELHLLINNAGVMACPLMRTAQGFEMQFGTNHLGHFLFTCLLAPALLAGAPARVIALSSAGHKLAPVNFDDPGYRERDYDKWQAYGESKTANALFAVELDRRLGARGVRAQAVHPGAIATNLGRHMQPEDMADLEARVPSAEMVFKSVEQGAATAVWAATAPELADSGGLYLEDCQVAQAAGQESTSGVESYAQDSTAAERLWTLSEELVGQTFRF